MFLQEVSQRPDRHAALLDAAEPLFPRALLYFERGGDADIRRANHLALQIRPEAGEDIGWQAVDVAIMLTRHERRLNVETREHLQGLLRQSLPAWSDRTVGRGNINHPVIAAWLYAAAGVVLGEPAYSQAADRRIERLIQIFSQNGELSEYNSPTYLGPTLVGLANIGTYAANPLTQLRARLVEERIWLNIASHWHAPTSQLAGPHSRAYADGTLGFGGVIRYLAHAVLHEPVFWDDNLAALYDHDHDAEWAIKIAASVFYFPAYLKAIAEQKPLPYLFQAQTECEDYTIDGREIYRGGPSSTTTYLAPHYCLGSAERPYVDGGQTEVAIAYWRLRTPVRRFEDYREIYFRYVANERLPGTRNIYHSWYSGRATMTYSGNLLHQDGSQHALQYRNKLILVAQPKRRENGHLTSLRFDALLPLHTPLDEIWIGDRPVGSLPTYADWAEPILLRDGDTYVALRPLSPGDLGGAEPPLQIGESNRHLIISLYNLRAEDPQLLSPDDFLQARNGLVLELGDEAEYGGFAAFRKHIAAARLEEKIWMGEIRAVRYRSGSDELVLRYNHSTQTFLERQINGQPLATPILTSPHACQGSTGELQIGDVSLVTEPHVPVWLVYEPLTQSIVVGFPTDHRSRLRMETPYGIVEGEAFGPGRIFIRERNATPLEIVLAVDTMASSSPLRFRGAARIGSLMLNGKERKSHPHQNKSDWILI